MVRFRIEELSSSNSIVAHRFIANTLRSDIQVHDARMVAAMHVHGIANLLTLNAKDFRRFGGITVPSPDDVLASFSQGPQPDYELARFRA